MDREEGIRMLRALAFHIHKKIPPRDAFERCIEDEGRGGRHRAWRRTAEVLETEGFIPALLTAELVSPETAAVLAVIENGGDHRQMSSAITAIADCREQEG
jgi:hypothetical protein